MKTIIVASTNPVKIAATLRAFKTMFPAETFDISGVSVSSDVAGQPSSDEETLHGAVNRATNTSREIPDADF